MVGDNHYTGRAHPMKIIMTPRVPRETDKGLKRPYLVSVQVQVMTPDYIAAPRRLAVMSET